MRASRGVQVMKILVTAASSSSSMSGVQRHALNMVRCLLLEPSVAEVHLVVAPWQRSLVELGGLRPQSRLITHVADMTASRLSRNLWYYRGLPKLAARVKPDLVHLSYPVPVDTGALPCPTILTLHDLYPYEIPRNFRARQAIFNRLILRQCLRNVDAITCVSNTTMGHLMRYAPPAVWRKGTRIYNCVEPEPLCSLYSPIPGWQGEPFLLCIAQHRRNKNISLLIRSFHRLLSAGRVHPAMKLVIIGIGGPETKHIHELVARLGLKRDVCFLEGLDEPELQWCYARCEALIAPSTTEGFGLPIAEAILAGCRVVCSDIPVFREIGGDHCRFVPLGENEEQAFADAIAADIQTPLHERIPLPQFAAETLAKQYTDLYRRVLTRHAPAHKVECAASIRETSPESQAL